MSVQHDATGPSDGVVDRQVPAGLHSIGSLFGGGLSPPPRPHRTGLAIAQRLVAMLARLGSRMGSLLVRGGGCLISLASRGRRWIAPPGGIAASNLIQ